MLDYFHLKKFIKYSIYFKSINIVFIKMMEFLHFTATKKKGFWHGFKILAKTFLQGFKNDVVSNVAENFGVGLQPLLKTSKNVVETRKRSSK